MIICLIISTFGVNLAGWMTQGFHLKLVGQPDQNGNRLWEPEASNRVWRPSDGNSLWLKSGQCDVRSQPLSLTSVTLETLMPASLFLLPSLFVEDATWG